MQNTTPSQKNFEAHLQNASEELAQDAIEQNRYSLIIGIIEQVRKRLGIPLNQELITHLETIFGIKLDERAFREGEICLGALEEPARMGLFASLRQKVEQSTATSMK